MEYNMSKRRLFIFLNTFIRQSRKAAAQKKYKRDINKLEIFYLK
jgi:hypothetical protein